MPEINFQEVKQFQSLEFLAKQVVEGFITGLHKSPFHGFSVEFAEHRLYNPGESTKHIDWKLYGRTEKLFIKRYEEETNLRCRIVLDTSNSMYYPDNKSNFSKLSFSIYTIAAIIELLKKQRDAVGLSTFNNEVNEHTDAKSSVIHHKLLYSILQNTLDAQKGESATFMVDALHQIAQSIHKRSLVLLFTDSIDTSQKKQDELFGALQHLKHNKHEVVLFHVTDKKTEQDFAFENRPYTFVVSESGEEVKLHPSTIKDSYKEQYEHFVKELKFKCSQYRIDFVNADINEGFNKILLSYLTKRSKMR